ncbi:MAG TPA: S8 family serine peptidase, partial [Actinomycetota bacterium]|nr:S8 family serine peptidase [Actinomycetota bacterium]
MAAATLVLGLTLAQPARAVGGDDPGAPPVPTARAVPIGASLSSAQVSALSANATDRVIVLLKNQHDDLPAASASLPARLRAESADQGPLLSELGQVKATSVKTYRTANALAATVSRDEANRLSTDPAVAEVLPDQRIQGRTGVASDGAAATPTVTPAPTTPTSSQAQSVCPTDPSKPLLEPELLPLTHTAFQDPSVPSAQQLVNGAGVKVAFIADGIDPNDPEFIRPDGSHAVVDYENFTGDLAPSDQDTFLEGEGDLGTIASQGTVIHDLSKEVVAQHALPSGCTIRIVGVAPGASIYALDALAPDETGFESDSLRAIDYAVSVAHVDVLSLSFGIYAVPDILSDNALRTFAEAAVHAGVTVVAAAGDGGIGSGMLDPASDPLVISAGATTAFQTYAQITGDGFQFSDGHWEDDNMASLSSDGPTDEGRGVDLVAPGDSNWAPCSTALAVTCPALDGEGPGAGLLFFGGTSEATPAIAGGAALVIEAYRSTHHGASPSPAEVKRILMSTADDLGIPSDQQGAGELDTLGAVRAAMADGVAGSAGSGLLVGPSAVTAAGEPGTPVATTVSVTNTGPTPEPVAVAARTLGPASSVAQG